MPSDLWCIVIYTIHSLLMTKRVSISGTKHMKTSREVANLSIHQHHLLSNHEIKALRSMQQGESLQSPYKAPRDRLKKSLLAYCHLTPYSPIAREFRYTPELRIRRDKKGPTINRFAFKKSSDLDHPFNNRFVTDLWPVLNRVGLSMLVFRKPRSGLVAIGIFRISFLTDLSCVSHVLHESHENFRSWKLFETDFLYVSFC